MNSKTARLIAIGLGWGIAVSLNGFYLSENG